jgi:D-glycero-alpha-D-manno-heptose-7-phosphate kinase
LPAYYTREPGFVLSCAIPYFVRVTIGPGVPYMQPLSSRFTNACCQYLGITEPLDIQVRGDVPPGTGLGSSGALCVATLKALHAWRGESPHPYDIAREACEVEINHMGLSSGRQDQYASAFGGINTLAFRRDGHVQVEPVVISDVTRRTLESHTLLLATNGSRYSQDILGEQARRTPAMLPTLREMADHAFFMRHFLEQGDVGGFCEHMNIAWDLKTQLHPDIAGPGIQAAHERIMKAGAWAAKLCGAGKGGYMLVIAPPYTHIAIRAAMFNTSELGFAIERQGVRLDVYEGAVA